MGLSPVTMIEGTCAYPTEKTQEQSSKLLILLLLKNSRCSLGKPSSSITFILAGETWMFEVDRHAIPTLCGHTVWLHSTGHASSASIKTHLFSHVKLRGWVLSFVVRSVHASLRRSSVDALSCHQLYRSDMETSSVHGQRGTNATAVTVDHGLILRI